MLPGSSQVFLTTNNSLADNLRVHVYRKTWLLTRQIILFLGSSTRANFMSKASQSVCPVLMLLIFSILLRNAVNAADATNYSLPRHLMTIFYFHV